MFIEPQEPSKYMGPNGIDWCKQKLRWFEKSNDQANAAKEDTRAYYDKYQVIHERKSNV